MTTAHTASHERNLKQGVAQKVSRMYRPPQVMAQVMARCRSRGNIITKAQLRPRKSWGFFMPTISLYGGTCGAGYFAFRESDPLNSFLCGWDRPTSNAARSATQTCRRVRGGSSIHKGTDLMSNHAKNPSATSGKAAAHRAMAIAALHADSSLSVRLKRYNHHVEIARNLEAIGGAL